MKEEKADAKKRPDGKWLTDLVSRCVTANNSLKEIIETDIKYHDDITHHYESLRKLRIDEKLRLTPLSKLSPRENFDTYYQRGIHNAYDLLHWVNPASQTLYSLKYQHVKEIAQKYQSHLEKTVGVKIDPYSKNDTMKELVILLSIILNTKDILKNISSLYNNNHENLSNNIKIAKMANSGFPWFLKKKDTKENIWNAIENINKIVVTDDYANAAKNLVSEYHNAVYSVYSLSDGIWDKFSKNTAPYYALLENIVGRETSSSDELGFDFSQQEETSSAEDVHEDTPYEDIESQNTYQQKSKQTKPDSTANNSNHTNTNSNTQSYSRASSHSYSSSSYTRSNSRQSNHTTTNNQREDTSSRYETYVNNRNRKLEQEAKQLVEAVRGVNLNTSKLKVTLRRYQEFAAKFIIHQKNVLIGDEMGLGKTIEAIAAMAHLAAEGETHFLVICPLGVLENWGREVHNHSTLKPYQLHGTDKQIILNLWKKNGGVGIATYESIQRLDVSSAKIGILVVDEAHYIKNPGAKRSMKVYDVQKNIPRVVYMTGTPMENMPSEMSGLIHRLRPDIGYLSCSDSHLFRLEAVPVYLRRDRESVLNELPDKEEIDDWGTMSTTELAAYTHSLQYDSYMTIRRHSWSLGDTSKSSKAQKLLEICEDAKENHRKVLVFSFFKDTLSKAETVLSGHCRCYGPIDGSVPGSERQSIIDAFSNGPAGSVLICQILSGGVGLNIQAANVVVICEPQWKPSTENQAISRAYRMGQANKVVVHRLLLAKTIDEHLMAILQHKSNLFNAFADKSETGIESLKENEVMRQVVKMELERYGLKRSADAET